MAAVGGLGEEVFVPQSFVVAGAVEDDAARQTAFGAEGIGLHVEVAAVVGAIEVGFGVPGEDVGVIALLAGAFSAVDEGERVNAVGAEQVAIE